MKLLIRTLAFTLLLHSGIANSAGIDVQISASLNFVELVHEVASWVKGAISRSDENAIKRINQSVPRLVGQLSAIAAEKNALANYLNSYKPGDSKAQFENNYRNRVEQLNQRLRDIRETIDHLDPQWEGENPMAKFNAVSAIAQKELFLQEYGMPDNLFEVNLVELANAYNNEAYNLLRASMEISSSITRVN